MYQPMKNLTRLQNQIVQARAASERVFELLARKSTVPEPAQPRRSAAGADIQFDHVQFAYGEKIALHDINLTIKSGQLVALVGASGSGKTTLSNLLLRFYDPHAARSKSAAWTSANSTRATCAIKSPSSRRKIFCSTTPSAGTSNSDVLGATNEEIIAAAKHAHAHQFISEKPEGYETRHRRKRRHAFRRPAPAHRHRPRRFAQRADFDFGRGHQRARHRIRTRRADRAR
jgi:ATP-binding cassette subfamily B multidrug efflux pump